MNNLFYQQSLTCSQRSLGWNHPQASAARFWSDQTPPPPLWSQSPHNPEVESENIGCHKCIARRYLDVPFVGFQSEQVSVEFWVQRVQMINVQCLACNKGIIIWVQQWQSVSSDQAALRRRKAQEEVRPTSSHTLPVQGLNQKHHETGFCGDNITLPSIRPMK